MHVMWKIGMRHVKNRHAGSPTFLYDKSSDKWKFKGFDLLKRLILFLKPFDFVHHQIQKLGSYINSIPDPGHLIHSIIVYI